MQRQDALDMLLQLCLFGLLFGILWYEFLTGKWRNLYNFCKASIAFKRTRTLRTIPRPIDELSTSRYFHKMEQHFTRSKTPSVKSASPPPFGSDNQIYWNPMYLEIIYLGKKRRKNCVFESLITFAKSLVTGFTCWVRSIDILAL